MSKGAGIAFSVRGRLGNDAPKKREAEDPFRLLLIGDFSGRAERLAEKPELRRPRRVDIAELTEMFTPFAARVNVPTLNGQVESLRLRSLEDLHPDALLAGVGAFAEPKSLLEALNEHVVSTDTLARARRYLNQFHGVSTTPASAPSEPVDGNDTSTLDRLLGRAPAAPAPAPAAGSTFLTALLEEAVRPHKIEAAGGERDMLKAELERVLQAGLRGILGAPAFSALEATWRGADRVIRALDTDEELSIYLFDLSLAELVETFSANANPEESELHRLLVGNGGDWTLLSADFAFDADETKLSALAGLAALSARAGGALLADAAPALFGCATWSELADPKLWSERPATALWHTLRESPLAKHIGLVAPRVLARARYGQKADPIDAFAFEELRAGDLATEQRLWSSGAFAVAELLGLAFRQHGWGYTENLALTLSDLPSDTFELDGERQLVPPSEVALSERAAEAVLSRGVMPFVARRDRASLALLQFTSISDPHSPLVGVDSET